MICMSVDKVAGGACDFFKESDTLSRNQTIESSFDQESGKKASDQTRVINIGLINNMQGASSAATELYFRKLLSRSAGDLPVNLVAFSPLEGSASNLSEYIQTIFEKLSAFKPCALIVTGMEPLTADLQQERLWGFLVKVFDWAEANQIPLILSCLAAHAAVLHKDGIARVPLKEKRFGIFKHNVVSDHWLTQGLSKSFHVPHSRWNELDSSRLSENGYQILTFSEAAGVDIFVKERGSLFIHFQGHLEYGAETLGSEYRRDVRRFLTGGRAAYPSLPQGYFSESSEIALNVFRQRAIKECAPELWKYFPVGLRPAETIAPWDATARIIFQNLLKYLRDLND